MCEPVTLLAASSALITGVQAISQYQAQASYAKAEQASILQSTTDAYKQADQQEVLVNEQAWQKENAEAIQAREAAATSATGAGEAGVSGLSVDALSRSYFAREGQYDESVNVNRQADIDRLQLQQQGFLDQAIGADNRIQQPSPLGLAASLAGAGLQAYTRLSIPTNPAPESIPNLTVDNFYVKPSSSQEGT